MAINTYRDFTEIFKFKSTVENSDEGLLQLFGEVSRFRLEQARVFHENWKPVDFYSDDEAYYVRMERQ